MPYHFKKLSSHIINKVIQRCVSLTFTSDKKNLHEIPFVTTWALVFWVKHLMEDSIKFIGHLPYNFCWCMSKWSAKYLWFKGWMACLTPCWVMTAMVCLAFSKSIPKTHDICSGVTAVCTWFDLNSQDILRFSIWFSKASVICTSWISHCAHVTQKSESTISPKTAPASLCASHLSQHATHCNSGSSPEGHLWHTMFISEGSHSISLVNSMWGQVSSWMSQGMNLTKYITIVMIDAKVPWLIIWHRSTISSNMIRSIILCS